MDMLENQIRQNSYKHGQNIWDKLYLSLELLHYEEIYFSTVFVALAKVLIWEEDWVLVYNSMKYWDFPDFS